jgi:hypothetical protein
VPFFPADDYFPFDPKKLCEYRVFLSNMILSCESEILGILSSQTSLCAFSHVFGALNLLVRISGYAAHASA